MNLKVILIIAMFSTVSFATAQESAEKYDTKAEMREQMKLIVNGLGLDTPTIIQLGEVMEHRRKHKEEMLTEIDKIKKELSYLEENMENQLKGMLSAEEWTKYQKEIKPKIDSDIAEREKKSKE